ncbi:MAG: putative polysaccharide biosynthesis protein [Gemmatimonadetes bacterium]|nr:putative polysaccharide biosynthesis protein [Gemmatimonadota bacterium]
MTIEALPPANDREDPAPTDLITNSAATRSADLDRSLMRGILWTSGVKWIGQAATWISTIVVARVLGPDAFGLVGMAMIYMGLVTLVSEFGIGSAVVTLRSLSEAQVKQVNSVAIMIGLVAMLISLAAATPVGAAFGVPEVRTIVLALSCTLLISSFQTVPSALLQREMRFKRLAAGEGTQTLLTAAVTVIFALDGMGFWSLVAGQIAGSLALSIILVLSSPTRFAVPRKADLQQAITFSSHMIVARLAWYVFSNADFAVVGRVAGKAALGAYTFGWTLANVPIEKVTSMVIRVTPSVLSAVRDDPPALRRYLLRITEAIAVITFPATMGLALVAGPLVIVALGEPWRAAIVPLRLLAIYSGVRSIAPMISQVLAALGETRVLMRWNAVGAVVLPFGFIVGSHWGAAGVAAAWILVHPIVLFPTYRFVFKAIELPVRDYFLAIWPALSGNIAMAVTVMLWNHFELYGSTPLTRLLVLSGVGAVTYVATLFLLHGERIRVLRVMIAELRAA